MDDRQIAVLIDYDNVGLRSIQWLFDQLSDLGRIIVKRAYGDWSSAGSKRDQLLELGVEPIQLFHFAASGKNSSDIRLAIDAIELLYQSPVDTFVIVSSDSDFVSLVSKLRASGKTVMGAGLKATAPRTLVISCDRYFYLDQDDRPSGTRHIRRDRQTDSLLVRAVKAAVDDQGRALGSRLHPTLQRLDPSFDFRALGYTTFAKYLEASPEVNVIRPKGPGDLMVELKDSDAVQTNGQPDSRPLAIQANGQPDSRPLAVQVDAAWSKRAAGPEQSMPGSVAAAAAAKVLRVQKLSASPYKTLQRLLDAWGELSAKWQRDGNKIVKK